MTELALESITKTKCLECGDKLTAWENVYCIICQPDEYEFVDEGDEYQMKVIATFETGNPVEVLVNAWDVEKAVETFFEMNAIAVSWSDEK